MKIEHNSRYRQPVNTSDSPLDDPSLERKNLASKPRTYHCPHVVYIAWMASLRYPSGGSFPWDPKSSAAPSPGAWQVKLLIKRLDKGKSFKRTSWQIPCRSQSPSALLVRI
ncbi:hypothetical protein RSAG8_07555, partial [Rhizoctonia solani AG-8 WAC10335]